MPLNLPPILFDLLTQDGIPPTAEAVDAWNRHAALVEEWNPRLHLVSAQDAADLTVHFTDSLSLAALVRDHAAGDLWVDVGSGGGFPAIPIAVLLPAQPLVLVERNPRKAGFLQKVIGVLQLDQARILQGEFPAVLGNQRAQLITARAVERPEKLLRPIAHTLAATGVYIDQRPPSVAPPPGMFHVEHITDRWTDSGCRRGALRLVRNT